MTGREQIVRAMTEGGIYSLTAEQFSLGRDNIAVARELLAGGVKLLQFREKKLSMAVRYKQCLELRAMTRAAGVPFIVNDDIHLALAVDADGVHVGQDDMPVDVVRRLIGPDKAIGLSTHSPQQAAAAVQAGVDYIGVGPIYATQTKEDVCAPVGLTYLDHVVANIDLPFVAIGGIKLHNLHEVLSHGARCVALVTEIVGAQDIPATLDSLHAVMRNSARTA